MDSPRRPGAPAPGSTGARLRSHRDVVALGVLSVVAGVGLRVFVLRSGLGVADFDEATVGVQADRFADGELVAFFPNQAYGGTLETALVALAFLVFGSSTLALKAVPMALAAGAAYLGWRAALRLVPSRPGRWVVPLLLWSGPAAGVLQSTKERGFYGVALVLATACVLLVLRLADDGDGADEVDGHAARRRDMALLGLVVGAGWWTTPLVMLVAVPAVGWLAVRRPPLVRHALPAVLAAVVGALPWLAWNARNGWASLDAAPTLHSSYLDRLGDWFVRLPVMAGLATPWAPDRQLIAWPLVARALVLALVVAATVRTWRRAPGLLAALVAGYALLYAINGLALGTGPDPRYMYLLTPILALCVGAVVPDAPTAGRRATTAAVVVALATALSLWGLWGTREVASRAEASRYLNSAGIEDVAALLDRRGVDTAVTEFAGTQVTFLTEGRVRGASIDVPRFEDDELAARSDPTTTYVLHRYAYLNVEHLDGWLRLEDVAFERHDIGQWSVFLLDDRLPPEEVGLVTFTGL